MSTLTAQARRRTPPSRLLMLMPLLTVVAALGLAAARPPDSVLTTPPARPVPVEARTLTCFELPDGAARSTVAVGLADVGELPGGSGDSSRSTLDAPLLDLNSPGAWTTRTLSAQRGGRPRDVVITADGPAAAGLDAFSADVAEPGGGNGLAVQHCAEPARGWWFVGAASTSTRSGAIVLHAPAEDEAVVDIVLRGPDGLLDAVGSQDIRVDAGSTVTLPLTDLVAGADDVAVEVRTSQGRVAAAVAETGPAGTEWLPAARTPAQTLLVPGIGGASGARGEAVLLVANPRERSVVARPTLVTETGRTTLSGVESVQVPGAGVAAVDLPPDLAAGSTIELRADAPLTASVRSVTGSDVATAAGAMALDGPAVVPVDLGADAAVSPATALTVSALLVDPEAQTVRSRAVVFRGADADGATLGTGSLELDAGTSRAVDLDEVLGLSDGAAADLDYVVVRPSARGAETAPVVGSLSVTSSRGLSVLPLRSLVTTLTGPVLVPQVVPHSPPAS